MAPVVHLVAKTHLDLGFTGLAAEVEARYLDDFFPRALAVAAELDDRGGTERLCWTTGSWILHRALAQEDRARAAAVAAGIEAGHLAWHALPFTTHTELMDVALFRSGMAVSAQLDDRFGRATTAAKMTDVPGHTRGMVPLLVEAGVTFLHLGVNPAWPVPDVPPVFRWRSPDGTEVVVAYQVGGYGGEVVVDGCDHVLSFLHAGDNLGPPSVDDVLEAHAALAARHPGAEVRASTLDAFARALAASGAVADLPVVTAEIGDPWLFGAGSDPQKLAAYRALLAMGGGGEPDADAHRLLALVAEHTWGLDQKVALPDDRTWATADLPALRASPEGLRFASSWAEQRAYVDAAAARRGHGPGWISSQGAAVRDRAAGWAELLASATPVDPAQPVAVGRWDLALDPATGAVAHLVARATGRVVADEGHRLGLVTHQTFSEVDYERFYAQLSPSAEDAWWARWDNTKPGIDACGARSATEAMQVVAAACVESPGDPTSALLVRGRFPAGSVERGAPGEVWLRWSSAGEAGLLLEVLWPDKPATRLPEATWVSFVPLVADPTAWELDKLGQRVSPLDVVARGGRSLHAVGEGVHHTGPDGPLSILTPDAPLVAPGAPNLLDADPPLPDLAGGFHVLLHDNCWGTNFPMWNEGPASFRFELR